MLAAAASLRATFSLLFGSYSLEPFLASPTGFAGWLFQSAWVPQHLMSASCVVTAMLLLVQYAQRQRLARLLTLVLIVVAGFESSTYVGGVTFAVAALARGADSVRRGRAGAGALRFAAGLGGRRRARGLLSPRRSSSIKLATVAARGGGIPIVIDHFAVLGDLFPQRCAACSMCRPIGSFCCRSNFRRPYSPAAIALVVCCDAPRRAGKNRRGGLIALAAAGSCHLLASGQHARRQ